MVLSAICWFIALRSSATDRFRRQTEAYLSSTTRTWVFFLSASDKPIPRSGAAPKGDVRWPIDHDLSWRCGMETPDVKEVCGGVPLATSCSELHPETDSSDCKRSGIAPISIIGELPFWYWGLLKGIQNVAVVPLPSVESRVISPCIKSTSYMFINFGRHLRSMSSALHS